MKKELLGYTIIFMKKEDNPMGITIEQGEGIKRLLSEGVNFIEISGRNLMVRANTIDRIAPRYKRLEERCQMCDRPKPIGRDCPYGCDKPSKYSKGLKLPDMPEVEEEPLVDVRCQACDILIEGGRYCGDCKKIYD